MCPIQLFKRERLSCQNHVKLKNDWGHTVSPPSSTFLAIVLVAAIAKLTARVARVDIVHIVQLRSRWE
jgi:hypothetical protein